MKVLFVNGHQPTPEGRAKFNTYHLHILSLLQSTLFYGQQHEETLRNYDDLEEFIFEEDTGYTDPRALQRFQLLDYVFVDGSLHTHMHSSHMRNLVTLIKMCVKYDVKCHLNRFGFLALYGVLERKNPEQDEEAKEGRFYPRQTMSGMSFYNEKRVQSKIYWRNTKFHYVCNSKVSGNQLLRDVKFPVVLYCRSQWLCKPVSYVKSACQSVVQTENQSPVVITLGNIIATITLCDDFLIILNNWICRLNKGLMARKELTSSVNRTVPVNISKENLFSQELQEDNRLTYSRTLKRPTSSLRPNTTASSYFSRPRTGCKKEAFSVIDPVVRISGPYLTTQEIKREDERQSDKKVLGRRFLSHSRTVNQFDIKNYVNQTPSEPSVIHKFRDANKGKWISKKPFYLA